MIIVKVVDCLEKVNQIAPYYVLGYLVVTVRQSAQRGGTQFRLNEEALPLFPGTEELNEMFMLGKLLMFSNLIQAFLTVSVTSVLFL